jgi:hypothetical protein
MPSDVSNICERLTQNQIRRRFMLKSLYRQENMMAARIRQILGWVAPTYDDNAEVGDDGKRVESREALKIRARARKILSCAMDGNEQDPEDQSVASALVFELEIVRQGTKPYRHGIKDAENAMIELAQSLPVYDWKKTVKGFGELGLAVIVAETGDLSNYATVSKVWKRLGLAPYQGKAASTWNVPKWRGAQTLTSQDWINLGYRKQRRAEVHVFLEKKFIMKQIESKAKSGMPFGRGKTKYGVVYVNRRIRTAETHPEWTDGHAQKDAWRVMSKAVIKDLWVQWNKQAGTLRTEPFRMAAE